MTARDEMLQMITAMRVSQMIYVAAELKLADVFAAGPKPVGDVAAGLGVNADALQRLLRALAGCGVFRETEPGVFTLTDQADWLRADKEGSLRDFAIFWNVPWHWDLWTQLLETVKQGKTGGELAWGKQIFDFLSDEPEAAAIFDRAMTSIHADTFHHVVKSFPAVNPKVIADVGGGHGTLLSALLARYRGAEGILFDLPRVADEARGMFDGTAVGERIKCVGGSFFETAPVADTYVLSTVIHDWEDEEATCILANIRQACAEKARVYLVETVMPGGNEPSPVKFLDIEMLLIGGRERTADEYGALFEAAGFELTGVIATGSSSGHSIIEASAC